MLFFYVGFGLYSVNVLVGLWARFGGGRFGMFHHILYASVLLGALTAIVCSYHPALLLTLAVLASFPLVSSRSWLHPALAILGAAGYVLALTIPN